MPHYRKYFTTVLQQHYADNAENLIKATEAHYTEIAPDVQFAATSVNPMDRRLDVSAYFLAMIKSLSEMGESFEKIKAICTEIAIDYVKPRNKLHQYIKKLIPKLAGTWLGGVLLKQFAKKVGRNPNPDGFIATVITDKEETNGVGIGFDIHQCGICSLYRKHQFEKYVTILCEVDLITSAQAGLILMRTSTIAYGAHKCDFRFKREN